MNYKEQFERETREIAGPLPHITEQSGESDLREIDALYGAADALSLQNAKKHRRILLELSAVGTLLTLLFLLYDEAELYGLILGCAVMILSLFLIRFIANRSQCHRKYLEYRVLAESLRVQYFLSIAGIAVNVSDLSPWSVRQGIPWISEMLAALPVPQVQEPKPIVDCWVKNQKEYHKNKLTAVTKKNLLDDRVVAAAVIVTIAAYIVALAFELLVGQKLVGSINVDLVRAILKIVVGTMSAVTLFVGNYYGKMSLPNVIDDHKRMIALYDAAEERIRSEGESRELLVFLAREFLNENSVWYAYQSKNKPDLVM